MDKVNRSLTEFNTGMHARKLDDIKGGQVLELVNDAGQHSSPCNTQFHPFFQGFAKIRGRYSTEFIIQFILVGPGLGNGQHDGILQMIFCTQLLGYFFIERLLFWEDEFHVPLFDCLIDQAGDLEP